MPIAGSNKDPSRHIAFDMPALPIPERQQVLLSAVAPRPIAFVGSLDRDGNANLAPFSFFGAFGGNPAVIGVSPAHSGRNATPKHSYLNIIETREFTVSIVNFELADQANLASCSYPRGVDEFVKAGLTKLPSKTIKAPGVLESPCVLECKLIEVVELGGKPGSGNLLVAEVALIHVDRGVLDENGRMDPRKIDQVSRLGYDWYSRARDGLFALPKPPIKGCGMGVDSLPQPIRESEILTGSDLARLALPEAIPTPSETPKEAGDWGRLGETEAQRLIQDKIRKHDLASAWAIIQVRYGKRG